MVLVKIASHKPLIIGCVYHPPNADQTTSIEYIEETNSRLTPKPPNANLIVTGDLYKLPVENLFQQFGLRNLVDFITREDFKLDLVLTNVAEYESPTKLAPIANNDHCCFLINGVQYHRSNYTKVTKRIVTPERKKRSHQHI